MKTTLTVSHLRENDIIRGHFEDKAARLETHVKRFKDDLTYLHGVLDKNPHKDDFHASLSLYLPSVTLHCRERGEDYAAALNEAFLALTRQINKYKDKLIRERRRTERRTSRP